MKYCEDATFWDRYGSTGTLEDRSIILSCDPGRKSWNTVMGPLLNPDPHGALWLYLPGKGSNPQRMVFRHFPDGHDFHPLGLEIWPSIDGESSNLFVVNHARERTVIEQFTLSPANPTEAVWIRTLSSKYFVSPNGLAMTSPTSFYVTNDHLMTRRLSNLLAQVETLLSLPLGWVAHVTVTDANNAQEDPIATHSVVSFGVSFANGVALSPDHKQLAVASSVMSEVHFYARDTGTNSLAYSHTVPVPFACDNIMYDDRGDLLVAGHPHFASLAAVAKNKTDVAPSWVVSISPRKENVTFDSVAFDTRAPVSASTRANAVASHEVETLFQSNGQFWSSSTTGLRDSRTGNLYVAGLYEEGLLKCAA